MMSWSRLLVLGIILGTLAGCLRDDDEPIRPTRPISRLYISTSQFSLNPEVEVVQNVYVVDPADGSSFDRANLNYRTFAVGGSAILYSPEARLLFQSAQNISRPDNSVQVMNIDTLRGSLSTQGTVNSELITAVRGIAYHPSTDVLLLANARAAATVIPPALQGSKLVTDAGPTQSDLFVYSRPRSRSNPALPNYRLPFQDKTIRAVFIHDISIQQNDLRNKTYISTTAAQGEILVYNELPNRLISNPLDSLPNISPDYILNIPSSRSLNSMTYSPQLDLMVATEAADLTGTTVAGQGRILFFENFSTHTSNASITPSRIITGARTLLVNPVSAAIDTREGAKYLYVADSQAAAATEGGTSGAVFRFLINDEGDVAPQNELRIPNRTPVSISLDARGTIPADSTANGNGASARLRR